VRSWLLSTLLALGPPQGPGTGPSRVELDVEDLEQHMPADAVHRLFGELLLRLLEAGHGIGEPGEVLLSLTSTDDAIIVECRVDDRREQIEVAIEDADPAVLGLELIHRAVDLADRCSASTSGTSESMVLDSDNSIEPSEVVVELADAPLTLVLDDHHAVWRLCVREREAWVVEVEQSCEAAPSHAALDPRAAVQRWQTSLAPPEPEPEPESELTEVTPPPEPLRVRAWGLSFGAAAGVQLRFPGASASVSADLAALHRSGVFVGALGSIAPSRADRIELLDGLALTTVGWRGHVTDRLVVRPSLGIGLAVHRYVFEDQRPGHRFDLALRVPLELDLRLSGRLYASLALAATLGTRKVEHVFGSTELWARGVLRLDALIGLRFDGRSGQRL
jgi:hypothetical protein